MRATPLPLAALALLSACSAGPGPRDEPAPPPFVALRHVASSGPLAHSQNSTFALMSPEEACVLDSYHASVVCRGPASALRRFGRPGGGPGEMRPYGTLVSVGEAGIAYLDGRNRRITLIDPSGAMREVTNTTAISPASDLDAHRHLHGHAFPDPALRPEPMLRMLELDGRSGDVAAVGTLVLPAGAVGGPGILYGAVVLPGGRRVAGLDGERVSRRVVFSAAGEFLYALDEPPFRPGRPTERDVERYREGYRFALLGEELSPADEAEFRRRPLSPYPRVSLYRAVQEDAAGNVWVLSNRRTEDGTWVDVYRDASYSGSLLLRGDVQGIQLRGDMLVALSEDMTSAIGDRYLDWYEVVLSTAQ